MTRKMIPIDEAEHSKLKVLAKENRRSMTAQVAYLVDEAWADYITGVVQPPVNTIDVELTDE